MFVHIITEIPKPPMWQVDAASEDHLCAYAGSRWTLQDTEVMERNRQYSRTHPHRESPESRRLSNRGKG
jgi:hypothetical protein